MFKRCKIVMLATNEKASIGEFTIAMYKEGFIDGKPLNGKLSCGKVTNISQTEQLDQHLYITSDEKIKEGDLCINIAIDINKRNDIIRIYKDEVESANIHKFPKIIATTKAHCNLPQPSQEFITKYIEEYNKGNIIEDVIVEYADIALYAKYKDVFQLPDGEWVKCVHCTKTSCCSLCDFKVGYSDCGLGGCPDMVGVNYYLKKVKELSYTKRFELEVNIEDNTINIKPIKDSWTREEMCLNMQYYYEYIHLNNYVTPQDWLDKYKHF